MPSGSKNSFRVPCFDNSALAPSDLTSFNAEAASKLSTSHAEVVDFSRLIGRRIVEQDSGVASLEGWLRRITLSWCWLAEQLPIECGRLRHVADLDRNVVHSAGMKESFLLRAGFGRGVAQLVPRLVRPDLYAGAVGV